MEIHINGEIDSIAWNRFLLNNQFSNLFQSKSFKDFIDSVKGFESQLFWVTNSTEIVALCVVTLQKEKGIKGYFSKRAIIYGGPLIIIDKNCIKVLESLLQCMNSTLGKRVIYGEIRNSNDYSIFKDTFLKYGWHYHKHLNVEIPLLNTSKELVLNKMKYNRRREIVLSINEGVIVREPKNINEVLSLYNILKGLYVSRVKSPLPTFAYFQSLFDSPIGKVFLVIHNNRIIGGSFCLFHNKLSINTLYYCGIRDYHKKIFPTHLAIMGAIEFGLTNNLKQIDLMGAGKPDEEYGVRNYKIAFGGELYEYGRFKNVYKPLLYRIGTIGLEIVNKLKFLK